MGTREEQGPQRCVSGAGGRVLVAEQLDLGLQDLCHHFCPLSPTGPRKGEEAEEWAPTERVSEWGSGRRGRAGRGCWGKWPTQGHVGTPTRVS